MIFVFVYNKMQITISNVLPWLEISFKSSYGRRVVVDAVDDNPSASGYPDFRLSEFRLG